MQGLAVIREDEGRHERMRLNVAVVGHVLGRDRPQRLRDVRRRRLDTCRRPVPVYVAPRTVGRARQTVRRLAVDVAPCANAPHNVLRRRAQRVVLPLVGDGCDRRDDLAHAAEVPEPDVVARRARNRRPADVPRPARGCCGTPVSSSAWSSRLTSAHRMSKPRGWLHGENVPSAPNARTCQYSDAWSPVIHGRRDRSRDGRSLQRAARPDDGVVSAEVPTGRELELVPRRARHGAQAKDGVRENVGGSPTPAVARESLASWSRSWKFSSAFGLARDGRLAAAPGGERDGRDACECRRSDKEARTPQTAEPALDAAMIVVVHLDAVCLSLVRVHELPPRVVGTARFERLS